VLLSQIVVAVAVGAVAYHHNIHIHIYIHHIIQRRDNSLDRMFIIK